MDLDWNSGDDRLLASILAYRHEHESRDVALVSSDAGPRLKARRLGIPTLVLPEMYLLEPELSDIEKDLRQAKTELARAQAAQPDLALLFVGGTDQLIVKPAVASPKERDIERAVNAHRQTFSLENHDLKAVVSSVLGGFAPGPKEVQRYRRALARYLERWERWYRREIDRRFRLSQTVKLNLVMVNNGRRPATEVGVVLDVPAGLRVLTELQESEPEDEPSPPFAPRSPSDPFAEPTFVDPLPDPWSPVVEPQETGTRVTLFVGKLQQGAEPVSLDDLYLTPEERVPFRIDFRITCDELHTPRTGHLNVRFEAAGA